MTVPDFYFVDAAGNRLPFDKDSIQHVWQYGCEWRVRVDGDWQGYVATDGGLRFQRQGNSDWRLTKAIGGRVGFVTALLFDHSGQKKGERVLQIRPANVSEKEMTQMVQDIGLLALASAGYTKIDIPTPVQEDTGLEAIGTECGIGRGTLHTVSSLLTLYNTFNYNWPHIQQRPLKSIRSKLGNVRLDAAKLSPMLMIKHTIEPHRTNAVGLCVVEEENCPENEFLAYILDHYLINLSQFMVVLLKTVIQRLSDKQIAQAHIDPSIQKRRIQMEHKRGIMLNLAARQSQYKDEVIKQIKQLEELVQWAKQARNSKLLKAIKTPAHLPKVSLRLTHSAHYGPVYGKFVQCQKTGFKTLDRVLFLLEYFQRHGNKVAWNIYEIWCVAQIYTLFITRLGLEPDSKGSLFEQVTITEKGIDLKENTPFNLSGRFGERKVNVTMWYEREYREGGHLVALPDIVIDMKVDGEVYKFCFDAKYRNYKEQGCNKFVEDIYATAYRKYQDGLKGEKFKSGFILHTDSNADYWGEVGLRQRLKEILPDKPLAENVGQEYEDAKHKYGGICFKPGHNFSNQLERLMQLMFHYHGSLRDVCLDCGYRLKQTEDMNFNGTNPEEYLSNNKEVKNKTTQKKSKPKGNGIYCDCPRCHNFWVLHHCQKAGHFLIKTSQETCIHRLDNLGKQEGKWNYVCPVCITGWEYPNSYEQSVEDEIWQPQDHEAPLY